MNDVVLRKDLFSIFSEAFVILLIFCSILLYHSQSGVGSPRGPVFAVLMLVFLPIILAYNVVVYRRKVLIFGEDGVQNNMSFLDKQFINYSAVKEVIFGSNFVSLIMNNNSEQKFMRCGWDHKDKEKILTLFENKQKRTNN